MISASESVSTSDDVFPLEPSSESEEHSGLYPFSTRCSFSSVLHCKVSCFSLCVPYLIARGRVRGIRVEKSGESFGWPRGLMDMASDFESGSCGFESHRGQNFFFRFLRFFEIFYILRHEFLDEDFERIFDG